MKVAVIGASANPERYSHMAIELLSRHGHRVFPIHPRLTEIEGLKVYASLRELPERPDTITLYVNSARSREMSAEILAASPRRIIFNPGAENPELARRAAEKGIEAVEACTLVLLKTGQF